eukprot:gene26990-32507_t
MAPPRMAKGTMPKSLCLSSRLPLACRLRPSAASSIRTGSRSARVTPCRVMSASSTSPAPARRASTRTHG